MITASVMKELTEIQYLKIDASEKVTHTKESMMLKNFIFTDSSDE